jgi:predicted transcriptional regulator of viral defense system
MSDKTNKLFTVAERQQGYFTAAQAVVCGYPTSSHVYHLKAGSWQRDFRGIYRLTRFPRTDDAQYALWSIWSRNRQGAPQGVYSHETALALFELSDLMPRRLHMTVPPDFRRNAAVPEILVLHKARVDEEEIEERQGYAVTKPIRTLADLLTADTVSPDHLRQALKEALKRGLITRHEIEGHPLRRDLENLHRGGRR